MSHFSAFAAGISATLFFWLAQYSYATTQEHGYTPEQVKQIDTIIDNEDDWLSQLEVKLYTQKGKKL